VIWLIAFGFLVAYEIYALIAHKTTLSQMATRADRRWPWVKWIVLALFAVLWIHFWWPNL